MDVDKINEDTMEFRMHSFVTEFWKDPRLNLDVFNITASPQTIPPDVVEDMWVPDLIFDNSKSAKFYHFSLPNSAVQVIKDNTLKRITRYSFTVSCPMVLHDYPMDVQHCGFRMAFFTTLYENATLQWSGDESSPYKHYGASIILIENIQPLKYEMKHPVPYRTTQVWASGTFSYLIANFTFIRRLTGNIVNVYVPSTLVVALSWLSFWLNVNAVPARITLGVTSILTLVTQVVQSRSFTPPVNYIKALDIWLFICISTVTASLIEYAIAYQTPNLSVKQKTITEDFDDPRKDDKPKWAKPCNNHCLRKCVSKLKEQVDHLIKEENKGVWKQPINCFDYYSRFLFPFTFIAFAIGYWVYYMSRRNSML